MPRRKRAELPRPELNITAMMDLVLNLVTFFVMVCNFAAASLPALTPPQPDRSLAKPSEAEDKIFVSLVSDPLDAWRVGRVVVGQDEVAPGDMGRLTEMLQREVAISPAVEIHMRADRALKFEEVEPYMLAVAGSGVKDIHYIAVPQD